MNELVYEYAQLRWRANELQSEADLAQARANVAFDKALQAWFRCQDAPPGIYSFKEMGRFAVVIGTEPNKPLAPDLVLVR
jgi:hypothetical protein